jgi:hypothetical protein
VCGEITNAAVRGNAIGREVGLDVPGLEGLQLRPADGPGAEHPARFADRVSLVQAVRAEASRALAAGVLRKQATMSIQIIDSKVESIL